MNLYQITQDLLNGIHQFIDEDGVLDSDNFSKWIAEKQEEFDEKVLASGAYIQNEIYDIKALKLAEKALYERRAKKEKSVGSLKRGILNALIALKKESVKGVEFDVSWRLNRAVPVIDDVVALPDCYKKTEIEIKIDRKAIENDIKSGKEVPGAHLEKSRSLQIK